MVNKIIHSKTASLLVPAAFFVSYALFAFWLWRSNMRTTNWNYAVNLFDALLYFFGARVGWHAYKQSSDLGTRKMYAAWTAGLAAWGIGLLIWSYYNLILKVPVPFPSLADIIFITYYGFMGFGALKMEQLSSDRNQLPILSSLPVVIISFIMVFFIFNRPDLSSDVPFLQRTISVGYSLGDSLLLSMTLVALQNSTVARRRKGAIYIIIAAFLVMLIADFIFYYDTAKQTYYNGNISDVLYGLFPMLLAWGMARSLQSTVPEAEAPAPSFSLDPN